MYACRFSILPLPLWQLEKSLCTAIEDVQAENGGLRLMKIFVWWEYDALPHALIAGGSGTGGGKAYFLPKMIEALLRTNAVL